MSDFQALPVGGSFRRISGAIVGAVEGGQAAIPWARRGTADRRLRVGWAVNRLELSLTTRAAHIGRMGSRRATAILLRIGCSIGTLLTIRVSRGSGRDMGHNLVVLEQVPAWYQVDSDADLPGSPPSV